jgi:hypothetical protein
MTPAHALVRTTALILLAGVLIGCSTTSRTDLMRAHMGVRPDEPELKFKDGKSDTCAEYEDYTKYAQQLQEAYHSRASQNRWWIYVAAITGLGAAAASGALAAATAVGVGTLALLSISGGFAAATFGTLNNTELANLYTSSANDIDKARLAAEGKRLKASGDDCRAALRTLKQRVSKARQKLELGRTNTAAGALERAKAAHEELDKLLNPPKPDDDPDEPKDEPKKE